LNLQKVFENRKDRPCPAFKSGVRCAARFSKKNCLIRKIFGGFRYHRVGSGQLSTALGAAAKNLLSNRSKGFELAGFERLFANSITFHAKGLRIYKFNIKLKGQYKKL
jgi:hypothetical protein